ncbi:hypothetical protein HHA02_03600 [Cobetia marina]|nr:hypothetical protein HHA02_03600 [Cobetia marina]
MSSSARASSLSTIQRGVVGKAVMTVSFTRGIHGPGASGPKAKKGGKRAKEHTLSLGRFL